MDASYGLVDLATCQAAKCVTLQLIVQVLSSSLKEERNEIRTQDHFQFMDSYRWEY